LVQFFQRRNDIKNTTLDAQLHGASLNSMIQGSSSPGSDSSSQLSSRTFSSCSPRQDASGQGITPMPPCSRTPSQEGAFSFISGKSSVPPIVQKHAVMLEGSFINILGSELAFEPTCGEICSTSGKVQLTPCALWDPGTRTLWVDSSKYTYTAAPFVEGPVLDVLPYVQVLLLEDKRYVCARGGLEVSLLTPPTHHHSHTFSGRGITMEYDSGSDWDDEDCGGYEQEWVCDSSEGRDLFSDNTGCTEGWDDPEFHPDLTLLDLFWDSCDLSWGGKTYNGRFLAPPPADDPLLCDGIYSWEGKQEARLCSALQLLKYPALPPAERARRAHACAAGFREDQRDRLLQAPARETLLSMEAEQLLICVSHSPSGCPVCAARWCEVCARVRKISLRVRSAREARWRADHPQGVHGVSPSEVPPGLCFNPVNVHRSAAPRFGGGCHVGVSAVLPAGSFVQSPSHSIGGHVGVVLTSRPSGSLI
jgi:hypothetical protein